MDPTWGQEFEDVLPQIESAIKEAAFIAIDCEFTGLKDPKSQIPKPQGRKHTIQERYQDVISHKNAGFALIQLGICPVSWDPERGHYSAKPFNFFVSPVVDPMFGFDRTFLCQSSAMEMLCKEGMDFNRLVRHGIRYLSRDEEMDIRARETNRVNGVREDITIDVGGEKFLDNVRLEIQDWIEDTSKEKYDFCNISVTSSYYKRLLHQTLPTMFPNLMICSTKKTFIQIVENKESTHCTIKCSRKQKFDSRINEAIGLRKIIEMVIQSRKALVGHNLFQDLVFIWSQFLAKLPDTMELFCHLVSETFPTVYDTKYISATHPLCKDMIFTDVASLAPLPPTGLENLALWVRQSQLDPRFQLCTSVLIHGLTVALHHKHVRYGVHEQQHQAGYDALLTAQVFLALAAAMTGRGGVPADQHNSNAATKKEIEGISASPVFESFKGGIFEDCKGMLSVNGTVEGYMKLD